MELREVVKYEEKKETETAMELTSKTINTEITNLELLIYLLTGIEEENANVGVFNENGVVGGRH